MNAIFVSDTLSRVIEKTSTLPTNEVEIYKQMISSQHLTYNLLIISFLGIIALFAGATWLYNRNIARKDIISETRKIFEEEKVAIIDDFKRDFEKDLCLMRGETARVFTLSIQGTDPADRVSRLHWWLEALKNYNLAAKGAGIRIAIDKVITSLNEILEMKTECKEIFLENAYYPRADIEEIISKVPEVLSDEKMMVIDLFNRFLD